MRGKIKELRDLNVAKTGKTVVENKVQVSVFI